jgi:glutathione S-transferase
MPEIVVHTLPGAWGLPSVSPFCLKLEVWLRLAKLEYTTVVDATPFGAPKRKLPYIEHEGKRIGDSGFIIEHLEQRYRCGVDASLSASERGAAHALRRLAEENLYWVMVYDRWVVDGNWRIFRDVVLGGVPAPVRPVVAVVARRGVRAQLKGHGIGAHTRDEIHAIGRRDLAAIADFLGDKPYLMGASPSSVDASVYGLLVNIMNAPIATPVKDDARRRANLVAYVERMAAI